MKDRLYAMAASLDERVKQFENTDGDERAARVIGTGAVAAGVGAGGMVAGKKIRNAVINRAGTVDDYGNMAARKGMYRDAAKSAVADAKKAAGQIPSAVKGKAKKVVGDGLLGINRGLRKASGAISKVRFKHFATPAMEYADKQRENERKLRADSRMTQGQVAGAAIGGGYMAGKLIKQTKGGVFKGRPLAKGVRGKAALLVGGTGAAIGSAVGGVVGANVRKKKQQNLAARMQRLHGFSSKDEKMSYGKKAAIGAGAGLTAGAGYGLYENYRNLPKGSKLIDGAGGVKSKMQQGMARAKASAGQAQDAMQRGSAVASDAVDRGRAAAARMGKQAKSQGQAMLKTSKRKVLKGITKGKKLVGLEALEDAVHELSAVMARR